ncbi:MAG: cytosine/adenosine deaminase-related metal-dependent hydrolase [Candidatus Paceibacteria bacterium]|jgi:cytosine/adenosine deaminase-related metal-dependent hydrolase
MGTVQAPDRDSMLVNGHTHLYSGLVPLGMPEPDPKPANFIEILDRVWWKLDRALDENSLRASAEIYVAHALKAGTTCLIDHHESPNFIEGSLDVLSDVCETFGMPALLCYGITERNGGLEEARRGLAENERFLQHCARHSNHFVRGAVGVHASFTVSDEALRSAAELAEEHSAPLHIHVAEDLADVKDAVQRGYEGVIDRLDKLGALQPGTLLAHGVHLNRNEVALLSERGCWLVQNPRSNHGNGVGYPAHLSAARRVALGTDGFPSNMLEERDVLTHEAAKAEASGVQGERKSAEKRLAAGTALARELFGDRLPVSTRLPTSMDLIQKNAKQQAAELWTRMARI